MSFQVPSLDDLLSRTRLAFRTYLPGSDAFIWPNNITPSAKVIAGMVFEVFGFASYIARMIFAHTAPDLEALILHGTEFGLALRPAAPATGVVRITTTGDAAIAQAAVFARSDGVEYIALTGATRVGAGTMDVTVLAANDGATGNAKDGTPLDIVSGLTGDALAAVYGTIASGADVEDLETFRERILFRKRNPPRGGASSDYVIWASSVSGVTRVFVEPRWVGVGTVRVFPLMDDLYPNGIAPIGEIQRVAAYIETVQPAGADVSVQAPIAHPINIQISGLTPDTTETREAVLAELRETFRRLSRVAGIGVPTGGSFIAAPFSFARAWIWEAVGNAGGVINDAVVVPASDVALTSGELPTLGTVTFT